MTFFTQVTKSGNDEYLTPDYAVEPLVKYLKNKSKIWCPFDMPDSNIVKVLAKAGHSVKYTHAEIPDKYSDFFDVPLDAPIVRNCDYIISNPPFSCKTEVLERLFDSNRPFAMLIGFVGLFESKSRFNLFKRHYKTTELLILSKRVYFKDRSTGRINRPTFSSYWVCNSVLPNQLIFEEITRK